MLSTLIVSLLAVRTVFALPAPSTATTVTCPGSNGSIYTALSGTQWLIECGTDHSGGDMPSPNGQYAADLASCIATCDSRAGCVDVSLSGRACYLKSTVGVAKSNGVFGAKLIVAGSASTTARTSTATSKATSQASSTAISTSVSASTSTASSTASSAPTSMPISTPQNPTKSTGKRGLPFNNPSTYLQSWNMANSEISWAYNWDSSTDSTFPTSLEYVPLLWGTQDVHTSHWDADVAKAAKVGSTHLMAFNEPDGCGWGQACLTPQAAVDAYKKYMMPYAGSFSLGAPSVTNGAAGMPWLKNFLALCTGCKIDFVPVHWYDSATNVAYFKNYMADATNIYAGGKPLWITEFNGAGTLAQQTTFMQNILPWMDAQSYIQRYAWEWCDPSFTGGAIVSANGQPTALGMTYATTQ